METLIAAMAALLVAASDGASVTSLKPSCGSLAGETRLTIYGNGFSEDQFSQNNDPRKGNQVYLVSASGRKYQCRVHKDGCTKTQIMCYTPQRMREEDHYVKIIVDNNRMEDKDICSGIQNSPKCTYKPQTACTPTIEKFTPQSGNPGAFVTMRGKLFSDRRGSNRATATNKRTEKITRVYVGPLGAELQFPGNDTFYGLALDNETSDYGTLKCKTLGTSVGFFNASFIIEAPFGRSQADPTVYHVSYNDKIYMYQQYTNIIQLSAHSGSVNGGLLLTIDAAYIDNRDPYVDLRVYVGDEVCKITEVIINRNVTCEVPAYPNHNVARFPGNRGVDFEYWMSTNKDKSSMNSIRSLTNSLPGYRKQSLDETYFNDEGDTMDNFVSRSKTFYSPPHSGVYQFYLRADDGGRLFVDDEEVVTSENYVWATSERMTLDSKKRYFLEILHYETTGNASVHLKVKYFNTTFTSDWTKKAVQERQNISVSSTVKLDIQKLNFTKFTSQSTAVNEVQTVEVNTADSGEFRFCLFEVCTEPLTTQIVETVIQDAISALPVFEKGEAVIVKRLAKGKPTYNITFVSNRGTFPDLKVEAKLDSSPLNFSIKKEVTGIPNNDMVALSFDRIVSKPVSVASLDQAKLQGAVDSLFEAKCPNLFSSSSKNMPKYHGGFEEYSPNFSGKRVKDTEPFCGRYVMQSPGNMYQTGRDESGIMLSLYGTFCFAYKGFLQNFISVTFSYKPSINSETKTLTIDVAFKMDSNTKSETWSYVCLNVFSKLKDLYPGGAEYRLQRVRVHNRTAEQPGFVDSVFIGQQNPTNDPEINLRRLRPARPNNALIKEARVRSISSTVYEVTLIPYECGNQFPLITLANGQEKKGSLLYPISSVTSTLVGGDGTMTNTRISEASPPSTGFIDIKFNGVTKKQLNISHEPKDFKKELESLKGIRALSVTKDGDCANYNLSVTYEALAGDLEQMIVSKSDVKPAGTAVTVSTVDDGGLFYDPIKGDMLKTSHTEPQVTLYVNDVPSNCTGDCSFKWQMSATPNVTSVLPATGTLALGTSITVKGNGFSSDKTKNNVTIGGVMCSVTAASATSITCAVGNGPVGKYKVIVNVQGKGNSKGDTEFEYTAGITSVSPRSGSVGGGGVLTVTGYGFKHGASVTINGAVCTMNTVQPDQIRCTVPAMKKEGTHDVEIKQGSAPTLSYSKYTYSYSKTATITSVTPTTLTVIGGRITVVGSSFTDTAGSVSLGSVNGTVVSWTDSQIVVDILGVAPGTHKLHVTTAHGYATNGSWNIPTIQVDLSITNVYPLKGSVLGGTYLTITGSSFGTDPAIVSVKVGDVDCKDPTVTDTKIVCKIGKAAKTYYVFNNGSCPDLPYCFNPQYTSILVGDTVHWSWRISDLTDEVQTVVEVDSPRNTTAKMGGFGVNKPSKNGDYTKQFTKMGTYYIWSGYMDKLNTSSFYGMVEVNASKSWIAEINVTVGGFEALNNVGGAPDPSDKSNCKSITTGIESCKDNIPTGSDPSKFNFLYSTCSTPIVDSIDVQNGTVQTNIAISGEGLSATNCQNEISFGDNECEVTSASKTRVTCTFAESGEPDVGVLHPFALRVGNLGNALIAIKSAEASSFGLIPNIKDIHGTSGSMAGGVNVSITGFGFGYFPSVSIGNFSCKIIESSYRKIICESPPCSQTDYDITVNAYIDKTVPVTAKCETPTKTCRFACSPLWTPSVTSIEPDVMSASTTVTITGSKLGTDPSKLVVTIGGVPAEVTGASDTSLIAKIDNLPAGNNEVIVRVKDIGKASGSLKISSDLTITAVQPSSGSINGGNVVTIQGNGFADKNTAVTFGDTPCEIVATTLSAMTCKTEAHRAASVNITVVSNGKSTTFSSYTYTSGSTPTIATISPISGLPGQTLTITGSNLNGGTVTVTLDNADCAVNASTNTEIKCTLGNHATGSVPVLVDVAGLGHSKIDKNFEYLLQLGSISPTQGSTAGGQTVVLSGAGFEDSTVVTICGRICTKEQITSSQYTCKSPANTAQTCDVEMSVNNLHKTLFGSYTYEEALTPSLSDIIPRRGGTGGGTSITMKGTGFLSDPNNVEVKIDKAVCKVESVTNTEIVCVTGQHSGSVDARVEVQVAGNGIAEEASSGAADFSYIDVWSSKYTWGGSQLPQEGDFIVVPAGMTLLLDVDTPILSFLLIQGGKLIFDDKNLELKAKTIMITGGGVLQVGTESEPFQHKAIITMYGHPLDPELPIYGSKVLAVRNGTLDLHGKVVQTTWTRLATKAPASSRILHLQHPVDWNVGDEIVIASTGHKDSQKENEKKTIAEVSVDKMSLTLVSGLKYNHSATEESFDGTTVDFRAEVGLLTHNVVFRGNSNPQWNDKINSCEDGFNAGEFDTQTCFQGRYGEEMGSDQYGGMILAHAPVKDQEAVIVRLSYIEVTYAGQAFRLGRYPVHFHLNGNMPSSYVRGCSIHQTFNRAVNIHGTHNTLVEKTVIYNIMGGAFFLEDGIETGNTIQYNLAVFVRESSSLLNDDVTPAAFWVTNPNNTIRHNAAAGGTHFGFWYRMLDNPDGPSYTPDYCPNRTPLGVFRNNSAHSCGWFGLWIFADYYPRKNPCSDSEVEPAVFDGFLSYNNEKGTECVDCGAVQFKNFILVQNKLAGYESKKFLNVEGELYTERGPMFKDSVIVATTTTIPDPTQGSTRGGLVLGYGPGFRAVNVTFVNFKDTGSAALRWARIDGTCSIYCGSYTYYTEGLTFVNSPHKAWYEWLYEGIILDKDGTAIGNSAKKGWTIQPTAGSLPGDCVAAPEYSIGPATASMCPYQHKFHGFGFNNIKPHSFHGQNALLTNEHGSSVSYFAEKRLRHHNGWVAALLSGTTYTLQFEGTGDLATSNVSFYAVYEGFESGDYVYTQIKVPEKPDGFSIDGGKTLINSSARLDPFTDNTGDWMWDNTNKMVKFLVNGNKRSKRGMSTYSVDRIVDLTLFKCPYPDCKQPQDLNLQPPALARPDDFDDWGSATLWDFSSNDGFASNTGGSYGIPKAYDDVKIVNRTWVVVNKTTTFNKLGTLIIEGVLEFVDTLGAQYVIEADFIIIRCGQLIIGWPDDPFDGLATITLRGNHTSPLYSQGDGPVLGSKAIGVFGGLDLFGKDKGRTWTQLAEKAVAGSNKITLKEPVQWSVGDDIVLGPTSFNPWESEAFKIISISSDQVILTLNSTLKFLHTAHKETLTNGQVIEVGAAVGLLSHNIKIVGQDYKDLYKESYGARVLVGLVTNNGQTCTGYARVSNVEFYKTGQEGFTEEYDPRFSLSYLNTGSTSNVKPSFVTKNSFHGGFSTAIGAIGIEGLNMTWNVVFGSVGHGIRISSDNARLLDNLVALVVSTPTYQDRYETFNYESEAGIEAMGTKNLTLQGNLITGAERFAFHISPQDCDDVSRRITNNKAFANVLAGVIVIPQDHLSQADCAKISGFTVWKTHDYGVYYQNEPSIVIEEILFIDNNQGLFPIVIKPDSVEHLYADKTVKVLNSTFVGRTDIADCAVDVTPTNDDNYKLSENARHKRLPSNGRVGFTAGNFYKNDNGLPSHPFDGCMAYPAIGGHTILKNVTFAKYRKNSCKLDYAVSPNIENDDGIHPVWSEDINFIDVDVSNKIFYHRPNIGKINSADCVDMDCDGHKKVLFKDKDGSFLGHIGAVISQSEFEWDQNPQRGLGNYRIPKEIVSDPSGNRMKYENVCPKKGIIRNDKCIYQSSWQAYECQNDLNYEMLIMESMDKDTETRRLSPIALVGDGYCDLINGPQDHGWCNGYTCRKRLSTFMALVATDKDYKMHFTSVTPNEMRYRLLNVDSSKGIMLKVWYSKPNRLDVYVDGNFIKAKNAKYDANGRYVTTVPKGDEYEPEIPDGPGTNFHDKSNGYLSFIIKGSQRIDVKTQTSLIVSLRLPSLTVDEFFGENIANNIAKFLGIPSNKVRMANVVSASSSGRRKRSDESIVEIEIGNEPVANLNDTAPDSLDYSTLLELASNIVNECQVGNLSESFNVTGECETVNVPSSGQAVDSVVYDTPSVDHLLLSEHPIAMHEGTTLQMQPKIRIADISNTVVTDFGTDDFPWQITASLRAGTGHPKAILSGTLTVSSSNGWFNFTDLVISHMGTGYILDFYVLFPTQAENFTMASEPFDVAGRLVKIHVFEQTSGDIVHNARFSVTLDLLDFNTEETISDIGWRDHTWTAEASLLDSSEYASLTGTLTSSFDSSMGRAMFPDLNFTGFGIFYIQFRVVSDPPNFNLTLNHRLTVKRPEHVGMTIEEVYKVEVKFDADFKNVLPTEDKQNGLEQMVLTSFANWWPYVYVIPVSVIEGSIIVTFSIAGTNSSVNITAYSICNSIQNKTLFTYNGYSLSLSPYLTVNNQAYYGVTCGDMSEDIDSEDMAAYVIILAVLVPVLLVIALAAIVWRCLVKPKTQTHVPVFVKPVTGNTKFNYTKHGPHYMGFTGKVMEDKKFLYNEQSFTSLGGSLEPPFSTSIGKSQFPQIDYNSGTRSIIGSPPPKLNMASRAQSGNFLDSYAQDAGPRHHSSLKVPVSPLMNQLEPRQASPSGRASPMLHKAGTLEREDSLPPVGEDKF